MTLFSSNLNLKKDLKKIRAYSIAVEKKLAKTPSEEKKIDNFTEEELLDFSKILNLADYVLTKHSQKKDFHEILKEFVGMINESIEAMIPLDDGIDEMVYSAEDGLTRIKEIQDNVSENYSFGQKQKNQSQRIIDGSKNLTNSSIRVYTQGYQPKPQGEPER